ncbi:MAG: hypothetical protein ACREA9_19840, partial [Pyrinomonadaceae bacterium]
SCPAFSVSATPLSPVDRLIETAIPFMREFNGSYVCSFLVSYLPLNQPINVSVGMVDDQMSLVGKWQGGTQPQPKPGQQRTIPNGSRTVTLTAAQSRVRLEFEMVYAPSR